MDLSAADIQKFLRLAVDFSPLCPDALSYSDIFNRYLLLQEHLPLRRIPSSNQARTSFCRLLRGFAPDLPQKVGGRRTKVLAQFKDVGIILKSAGNAASVTTLQTSSSASSMSQYFHLQNSDVSSVPSPSSCGHTSHAVTNPLSYLLLPAIPAPGNPTTPVVLSSDVKTESSSSQLLSSQWNILAQVVSNNTKPQGWTPYQMAMQQQCNLASLGSHLTAPTYSSALTHNKAVDMTRHSPSEQQLVGVNITPALCFGDKSSVQVDTVLTEAVDLKRAGNTASVATLQRSSSTSMSQYSNLSSDISHLSCGHANHNAVTNPLSYPLLSAIPAPGNHTTPVVVSSDVKTESSPQWNILTQVVSNNTKPQEWTPSQLPMQQELNVASLGSHLAARPTLQLSRTRKLSI
jgi:hypothetical protein